MSIDEDAFRVAYKAYHKQYDDSIPVAEIKEHRLRAFLEVYTTIAHDQGSTDRVRSERAAYLAGMLRRQAGKWQPLERDFLEAANIIEVWGAI